MFVVLLPVTAAKVQPRLLPVRAHSFLDGDETLHEEGRTGGRLATESQTQGPVNVVLCFVVTKADLEESSFTALCLCMFIASRLHGSAVGVSPV